MTTESTISLAVWDVPMPAVASERFAIKVGAKAKWGGAPAGRRVEITDASGTVVASGALGASPFPGTEALVWTTLDVPAPREPEVAEYVVRFQGDDATARFSVAVAAKPEHTLSVTITEQETKAALGGVEIRLGPFHGRTDKSGRADVRVAKGAYRLELWRTAHIAEPKQYSIDGDISITLTMLHVPEDHPDARWVR